MSYLMQLVFTAILFGQAIHGINALKCYKCIPVLQLGTDCVIVNPDQLTLCAADEDVCRTTVVSMPKGDGTRVATINRECAKHNPNIPLQAAANNQRCTPPQSEPETQRISRMCECTTDSCNQVTISQLNNYDPGDTSSYRSGNSANTVVLHGSLFALVVLCCMMIL